MLISEKTTESINFFFFFASKEAYPIVRQLEKITVKKAEAKVVKCAKNKSWVPRNPLPLGHLSAPEVTFRKLPSIEFFMFYFIMSNQA